MKEIIRVENLSKVYHRFKLENISFSIFANSITGFLGINGAGKTTTIKMLLGLIKADSGSISFLGEKQNGLSREKINNSIGIVLDKNMLYEHLTCKQMVNIYRKAFTRWNNEMFTKYISKFKLPMEQKIETYSKGMKVKLSLALALSHEPKILIMDEPTSGLDPFVRKQFIDILSEWVKEEEHCVFFSTHILSDIEDVADHIILINDGKIILDKTMETLKEEKLIVLGKTGLDDLMLKMITGEEDA
ncbi:MAG: ABC transporter ATP-binding protein [Lachnospiraceae bacterium]|nr:ABC transporter ATP-binding protein [Lachnospiraceae bacterium]